MNDTDEQNGQQSGQTEYRVAQPQLPAKELWWSNFVNFRKLMMFSLIKYLYVFGALVVTITALRFMFSPIDYVLRIGGFWQGLVLLLVGNLIWRLVCESIIVLFRIAEGVSTIETRIR